MSSSTLKILHGFRFGSNKFNLDDFSSFDNSQILYLNGLATPYYIFLIVIFISMLLLLIKPIRHIKFNVSFTDMTIAFIIIVVLVLYSIMENSIASDSIGSINKELNKMSHLLTELSFNYSRPSVITLNFTRVNDFNDNALGNCRDAVNRINSTSGVQLPAYEYNTVYISLMLLQQAFEHSHSLFTDVNTFAIDSEEMFNDFLMYWHICFSSLAAAFLIIMALYYWMFNLHEFKGYNISGDYKIIEKTIIVISIIIGLWFWLIISMTGSVSMLGSDFCVPETKLVIRQFLSGVVGNKSMPVCNQEPYKYLCNIQDCLTADESPFHDINVLQTQLGFLNTYLTAYSSGIAYLDSSSAESIACVVDLVTIKNFFNMSKIIVDNSAPQITCGKLSPLYKNIVETELCKNLFTSLGNIWIVMFFVLLCGSNMIYVYFAKVHPSYSEL